MSSTHSFFRRHKILTALAALVLIGAVFLYTRTRGPFPDYNLDILIPPTSNTTAPGVLEVGVAREDISPDFDQYDPWTDVDNNNRYNRKIDKYEDRNGNGKFDGIWLAGFGVDRPAKDIHDPPLVSAMALRNNGVTIVLVTVDSIGIFNNEFIKIRKMIEQEAGDLKIDHIMFSSTHCHELPDTMKIWSGPIPILGYQPQYMDLIQKQATRAIEEAVRALKPADMFCTQVRIEPEGFVRDSREPQAMDNNMYLMRFTEHGGDKTIATFVNWGNHPETLGGENPHITADFPHYLRDGVEKGVPPPNGVEGFGGMCLFFQGQIGGLMTELDVEVPHRDGQRKFKEASFDKCEALGQNLAIVACNALRSPNVWKNENPKLAVMAKSVFIPMQGMYKWAIMLGLIHEGYWFGSKARTEINVLRIGDVLMLATPGEIYPEIVEGGVVALPGRDIEVEPQEVPPLRTFMQKNARMAFVVGLANDEIGYMVPQSQWDAKKPFIYNGHDQYGEGNSGGPMVSTMIHHYSRDMLEAMNKAYPLTAAK